MKRISLLLCLCVPWLASANSLQHPLIASFPESRVFSEEHRTFDSVRLVAGEISYQQGDYEGYASAAEIDIEGETKTYIHDYPESLSAMHLYQDMLSKLQKNNFEMVYQCEQEACNDVNAWKLYLSPKIMGKETSQYYLLARQQGANQNQWYVQFYAINLDGEPRSFMRIVNAKKRPQLAIALNDKVLAPIDSTLGLATLDTLPSVLFGFDKTTLAEEADNFLIQLTDKIIDSGIKHLVIAGHTDSSGDASYNQQLSHKRAEAIAAALKAKPELNDVEISIRAQGASSPVTDNDSREGRAKNRRVSFHYDQSSLLSKTDLGETEAKSTP